MPGDLTHMFSSEPDLPVHVIGYLIAMLGPIPALAGISSLTWRQIAISAGASKEQAPTGYRGFLPAILGVVERFLYVASILAGFPEFIGVWLVLKVAGGWKGWSEGQESEHRGKDGGKIILQGRDLLNSSLLGSALSLIWAIAGVATIGWWLANQKGLAVGAPLVALGGTYGLWLSLLLWWRHQPESTT